MCLRPVVPGVEPVLAESGQLVRQPPGPPRFVATGMEVQRDRLAVELGFELVFDIRGGHQDPAEIARRPAALAAPYALDHHSAQGGHRQPFRAELCGVDGMLCLSRAIHRIGPLESLET